MREEEDFYRLGRQDVKVRRRCLVLINREQDERSTSFTSSLSYYIYRSRARRVNVNKGMAKYDEDVVENLVRRSVVRMKNRD